VDDGGNLRCDNSNDDNVSGWPGGRLRQKERFSALMHDFWASPSSEVARLLFAITQLACTFTIPHRAIHATTILATTPNPLLDHRHGQDHTDCWNEQIVKIWFLD
jgi:hypothetical protein